MTKEQIIELRQKQAFRKYVWDECRFKDAVSTCFINPICGIIALVFAFIALKYMKENNYDNFTEARNWCITISAWGWATSVFILFIIFFILNSLTFED